PVVVGADPGDHISHQGTRGRIDTFERVDAVHLKQGDLLAYEVVAQRLKIQGRGCRSTHGARIASPAACRVPGQTAAWRKPFALVGCRARGPFGEKRRVVHLNSARSTGATAMFHAVDLLREAVAVLEERAVLARLGRLVRTVYR